MPALGARLGDGQGQRSTAAAGREPAAGAVNRQPLLTPQITNKPSKPTKPTKKRLLCLIISIIFYICYVIHHHFQVRVCTVPVESITALASLPPTPIRAPHATRSKF